LPTFRVSDVPPLEEPVTDLSSWKGFKEATLSEDCMKKFIFSHDSLLIILIKQ